MDNVCHSLAGAVIAECGFARRSRFATAALVIAANIPDVDVMYLFAGEIVGLESRRGWTHGIPALLTWPFVILAGVMLWHRLVRRGDETDQPIDLRWLWLGALVAVLSHPALDWLNTYGVRFYGDTLFIVDLVLLALFGTGWWLSRRARRRELPNAAHAARVAVALALVYIVVMKSQSERSRGAMETALGLGDSRPQQLMVAPLPASMRTRSALAATDSGYVLRQVRAGLRVAIEEPYEFLATHRDHPLSRAAQETEEYRRFMRWSRFPYFVPAPDGDSSVVFVGDARYARGSGNTWAGIRIKLDAP
jgi:inner membrane protein